VPRALAGIGAGHRRRHRSPAAIQTADPAVIMTEGLPVESCPDIGDRSDLNIGTSEIGLRAHSDTRTNMPVAWI
jgi:hypothetical protein